eukprot:COSAG06_NODE_4799_length_3945_cov_8.420376_1_plen_54_part_10
MVRADAEGCAAAVSTAHTQDRTVPSAHTLSDDREVYFAARDGCCNLPVDTAATG